MSSIENNALPEFLQIIENLTQSGWYYVLITQKIKGTCLSRLGKREEATEILRWTITDAKAYPGVSNNLVSQCTHGLNQFLVRTEEWHELCENSRHLLGRISKELGPYHKDALFQKRGVIEYNRMHLVKTGVLGRETWRDPKVFGTYHCLELSDDTITITVELAIAYQAFGMESEIQPLWDGVTKQIRDEQAGEELIDLYIRALGLTMDAAHRQGYHYFGLLLKTAIAGMEKARDDFFARSCELRLDQLESLRLLWNDLESFYEVHRESPQSPSARHISETILRTVWHTRKTSQPSMLFVINHFLQWMIQSDLCTTHAPVSCNILEGIQELTTSNFGHWKDSNNTMTSTVYLVVSQRLLGEKSKALETEDEMLSCRIQEEKSEPRFIPGRRPVNLVPATLGIEQLHIEYEYRRREWYSASMRLYQIAYEDFVISLGIQASTTVLTMKLLFEIYGRVSELKKPQDVLANLELMLQDGDMAKKQQILDTLTAVSSWCCLQDQYETAWHLILFLIRLYWPIAAQSWRIQIAKDAEIVARKTGRLEEIPSLIEARERIELVIKTGNDLATTKIPGSEEATEHAPTAPPAEAGSLQKRFKLIGENFSSWRAKKG